MVSVEVFFKKYVIVNYRIVNANKIIFLLLYIYIYIYISIMICINLFIINTTNTTILF